ncbi:MAG TPA: hypothetical protein VGN04_09825 [Herbaspirillum sp.]
MRALPIFCLFAWCGLPVFSASAADLAQPAQADADACVDVVVNGQHSQSFACLTQKLQPAKTPQASVGGANSLTTSEEIARRPSNQIGLFNYSATSHRMGNQFGISVFPQRPAPQPPPSFPHIHR